MNSNINLLYQVVENIKKDYNDEKNKDTPERDLEKLALLANMVPQLTVTYDTTLEKEQENN